MSDIKKRMTIHCNGDFIDITGRIGCSILGDTPDSTKKEIPTSSNNNDFGNALEVCLNNSKELTNDEWDAAYGTDDQKFYDSMIKKYEEYTIELVKKYGYKSKTVLYKNMMSCHIEVEGHVMVINIYNHIKLDVWEGTDNSIKISYNSPSEIIGAAVRYAFSRCKGKGPYAKGAEIVTKALFPDGVPNSLEEYLESINKDYKQWLVK